MEFDCEDCCPEPFDEELLDCDDDEEEEDEDDGLDWDDELDDDEDVDDEVEVDEEGEPVDDEGMLDDVVCCIVQAPSAAVRVARSNRLALRRTPM